MPFRNSKNTSNSRNVRKAHVSKSRNDINSEDFRNRSDAIYIRNASISRDANNRGEVSYCREASNIISNRVEANNRSDENERL